MTADALEVQLVICGLGGQGAIFLTRLLAEAAMLDGRAVITAETHGMAQRGGAVESHVKLGDFAGSTVRRGRADAALVLDASRIGAAQQYLRHGGLCFADTALAPPGVRACDASGLSKERCFPRRANLVLLGFASGAATSLLPRRAALLEALERLSPPAARQENRAAFEAGGACA